MSPILKVFRPRAVCALLLCLSRVPPLSAQGNTATIAGTVADPSRAAIPDATVTAKNLGTDISQTVVSDSQGRFRIPQLGLGNYEIRASKMGFSTVVRQGVTLTVGSESVIDFALPVGQAQQTVTVEGQVSQVETSSAAISNLVEPTQMRELPLNGRNFEQLLTLAPGVQQLTAQASNRYGTQGNYSVAGSRGEGMLYLLDNTNIQGFFNHGTGSGATGASLGVEAISEFQTLPIPTARSSVVAAPSSTRSANRAPTAFMVRPTNSCVTASWTRVVSLILSANREPPKPTFPPSAETSLAVASAALSRRIRPSSL